MENDVVWQTALRFAIISTCTKGAMCSRHGEDSWKTLMVTNRTRIRLGFRVTWRGSVMSFSLLLRRLVAQHLDALPVVDRHHRPLCYLVLDGCAAHTVASSCHCTARARAIASLLAKLPCDARAPEPDPDRAPILGQERFLGGKVTMSSDPRRDASALCDNPQVPCRAESVESDASRTPAVAIRAVQYSSVDHAAGSHVA